MKTDTKDILDNMNNLPCDPLRHMYCATKQIKETCVQRSQNRVPASINLSNCKTEVKNSLTKFSSDWCNKKGVPVGCFTQWISLVIAPLKELGFFHNVLQQQNNALDSVFGLKK